MTGTWAPCSWAAQVYPTLALPDLPPCKTDLVPTLFLSPPPGTLVLCYCFVKFGLVWKLQQLLLLLFEYLWRWHWQGLVTATWSRRSWDRRTGPWGPSPPRRVPAPPSPAWGKSPAKSCSFCLAPSPHRPICRSSSSSLRGTLGGASPGTSSGPPSSWDALLPAEPPHRRMRRTVAMKNRRKWRARRKNGTIHT